MVKKATQLEQLRATQSAVNDLFLYTDNHKINVVLYDVMDKLDQIEEIIKEAK